MVDTPPRIAPFLPGELPEIAISTAKTKLRDWIAALSGAGTCFVLSPVAFAPPLLRHDGNDVLRGAMVIVILVLSLATHEAAHAWAALKCGDPTARDLGRLTLNPIPSIDPWMTIALPALLYFSTGRMFGGAKPVPVSFHRLRKPWRDMSLVALAGPFTNLLIALVLLVAYEFFVRTAWYNGAAETRFGRMDDLLPEVLYLGALSNIGLFVFNLVPIPPLDGSRVMAWLLPSNLRESYVALERWGMLIVIGLLYFSPAFNRWIWETVSTIADQMHEFVQWTGGLA